MLALKSDVQQIFVSSSCCDNHDVNCDDLKDSSTVVMTLMLISCDIAITRLYHNNTVRRERENTSAAAKNVLSFSTIHTVAVADLVRVLLSVLARKKTPDLNLCQRLGNSQNSLDTHTEPTSDFTDHWGDSPELFFNDRLRHRQNVTILRMNIPREVNPSSCDQFQTGGGGAYTDNCGATLIGGRVLVAATFANGGGGSRSDSNGVAEAKDLMRAATTKGAAKFFG